MKYVEVGGVRLSAVGLGTWQFGSGEWGYGAGYAAGIAPEIVAPFARARREPVRHRRDLRLRALRADRRRGARRRRDEAVRRHQALPGAPASTRSSPRRAAGSLRRLGLEAHRPLPGPLAEPARPARAHDVGDGAAPAQGARAPRRGLQLLASPSGRTRSGRSADRCSPTRSSSAWSDRQPLERSRPVGPGERPDRHRLQPARPGAALGPLRRRLTDRVACGPRPAASCPRTCAGSSPCWPCCARWPPPTTPAPPRWRWPG